MTTVAFFNNKGGVGQTSLVYHLAWMLGEYGRRIIAADLDPQASLTGMFLDDARLEELWRDGTAGTINDGVAPLFDGTGDIVASAQVEEIGEKIGLLMGDLTLSKREDELSTQWPKCLDGDGRAFRVTTAFARLIERAGEQFGADLALLDVGPNLGAINRAALVKDYRSLMPMAQEAKRPMFLLKPADGAIGAHQWAVLECHASFHDLARELLVRLDRRG